MERKAVGVLGAGVIGVGVAQDLAQAAHRVVLVDIAEPVLERAREEIAKNIRFHAMFAKGADPKGPQEVLEQITFTTNYNQLSKVDFVVENVTEKWAIKKEVFEQIDGICPHHCIFASNTSAIPITRIASVTGRADRVLGIHFMNPVPLKSMVEMIRGYHTSEATLETARALLKTMGKDCIVVNDSPGFASNRVLMLMVNEAIWLLHDRVANAHEVDRLFKGCFAHKMGPLELADLIGLDTILYTLDVLCECFGDSKYRPCPLLSQMVDAGLHGRKSGRGFYSY